MSKYTPDQINEAIDIVQDALEDCEVEYFDDIHEAWLETSDVSYDFKHRAKKKPREFWIVGSVEQSRLCEVYSFDPVETENERAAYAGKTVTKVREVTDENG